MNDLKRHCVNTCNFRLLGISVFENTFLSACLDTIRNKIPGAGFLTAPFLICAAFSKNKSFNS